MFCLQVGGAKWWVGGEERGELLSLNGEFAGSRWFGDCLLSGFLGCVLLMCRRLRSFRVRPAGRLSAYDECRCCRVQVRADDLRGQPSRVRWGRHFVRGF